MGKLAEKSADYTPLQPDFPTTYREEGLVGKRPPASPPPIQMTVSWGSCETSADYTPFPTPNFPTTYREEGLVGKRPPASPPPIEKRRSWGSW